LLGVTWSDDGFIATGTSILSSPEGITWSSRLTVTEVDARYSGVAHGNGKFVTVGGFNDSANGIVKGYIQASPNGVDWSKQTVPAGVALNSVAYGNGLFVAGGEYGAILTSTDGARWTPRTSLVTTKSLTSVAQGNGTLVAVGDLGAIVTSTNGIQWRTATSGTVNRLNDVCYGDGKFVAVGAYGTIVLSPDGRSWSRHSVNIAPWWLWGVTFAGGRFVAVGEGGTIRYSADATNWNTGFAPSYTDFRRVTYGNGVFVAVGAYYDAGTSRLTGNIAASTDGASWGLSPTPDFPLRTVTFGNGTFVAAGSGGLVSTNGLDWRQVSMEGGPAIGFGAGTFVAVSFAGAMSSSFDGLTWIRRGRGTFAPVMGIRFFNDTFVAIGDNGMILQSRSLAPATLNASRRPGDSGFDLSIKGEIGRRYQIQATSDLAGDWIELLTFTNTAPATEFVDTSAPNFNRRFYRVVSAGSE
jgi:hypothetical protein